MTERAIRGERASSCARPADVGARSPECAIRYEDVSFSYKPGVPFMEGLSAAIPAGAVTSIVGPNGCGKSTLVKLAAGLLRPTAGRVEVAGHDTGELASRERAHLMAVLAQSSRVPPMTVEALVACGRHPHLGWGGRLGPDDRAAVEAAMERAGVARLSQSRPAPALRRRAPAGRIWPARSPRTPTSSCWTSPPPIWISAPATTSWPSCAT